MKSKKLPIFWENIRNSFFIISLILLIYTIGQLITFWMFTDEYERDLLEDRYKEIYSLSKNINKEISEEGFYKYLQGMINGESEEYIRIYSSDKIYYQSDSEIWLDTKLNYVDKNFKMEFKIYDFSLR